MAATVIVVVAAPMQIVVTGDIVEMVAVAVILAWVIVVVRCVVPVVMASVVTSIMTSIMTSVAMPAVTAAAAVSRDTVTSVSDTNVDTADTYVKAKGTGGLNAGSCGASQSQADYGSEC